MLAAANKARYKGSVLLCSICWARGLPQSNSIHNTAKLTMNFPKNVVTTNFHGVCYLDIPRSMIIMSSGGIGVKAAINEPSEPYFARNICKGVILLNVFFLIRLLP